jgi:hypothetical protein
VGLGVGVEVVDERGRDAGSERGAERVGDEAGGVCEACAGHVIAAPCMMCEEEEEDWVCSFFFPSMGVGRWYAVGLRDDVGGLRHRACPRYLTDALD